MAATRTRQARQDGSRREAARLYALIAASMALIGGVLFFAGVRPLAAMVETRERARIAHEVALAAAAVDGVVERQRLLAAQIASRSALRARLVDLLDRRLLPERYESLARPKLRDAMLADRWIDGVARFRLDSAAPAAGVGLPQSASDGAACRALGAARPTASALHRALDGEAGRRLAYCAPVVEPGRGPVGVDRVLFDPASLAEALARLRSPHARYRLVTPEGVLAGASGAVRDRDFGAPGPRRAGEALIYTQETAFPGLRLVAEFDEAALLAPARAAVRRVVTTAALAALAACILAAAVIRPLLRRQVATEAARRAEAARARGLAEMSHEIRTPLNGLLGAAELLSDSPLASREAEMVETMRRSGAFLLRVLNDALESARIASGEVTLERTPFDLVEAAEAVRAIEAGVAEARSLSIGIRVSEGPRRRIGDRHRVQQILLNLVSNALKFTERGAVEIALDLRDPQTARIAVRDEGVGMTAEQVARVFEPFAQAEAGTHRRHGGAGLGLAIVKGLTDAMAGTVCARSTPGRGTVFELTLPLAEAAAEANARPAQAPATTVIPRGLCALVVDDNEVNRQILSAMLSRLGVVPAPAESGTAALAAHQAAPADVVFLDLRMPGLDGYATRERLVALSEAAGRPAPPMLLCTAADDATEREAAARAGFAALLPKPVRPPELAEALAAAVAARPAAEEADCA